MKLALRLFSAVLALATVCTVFAGCKDREGADETRQLETNTETELQLAVIGAGGSEKNAVEKYIKAYEAEHEGTKVRATYLQSPPDSLKEYDTVLLSAEESLKYSASQLEDISKYTSADGNYKNIIGSADALGTLGGKKVFIPFNYNRAVVYANKNVLENKGVGIPEGEYSYKEFTDMLKKLSAGEDTVGISLSSTAPYVWKQLLEANGAGWYDKICTVKSKENEKTMIDYYGLYRKKHAVTKNFDSGASDRAVAMSWSWAAESGDPEDDAHVIDMSAPENIVVLSVPYGDKFKGSVANTEFISGFAVVEGSGNPDKAAELALYALSETGAKALNEGFGGMPVNREHFVLDYWKKGRLAAQNTQALFVNIENDIRSDYADALPLNDSTYTANEQLKGECKEKLETVKYKDTEKYYSITWGKFVDEVDNMVIAEKMKAKNFICQVEENTSSQMMSYIIVSNGEVCVIDGGMKGDGRKLVKTLQMATGLDKPVVSKWLFTHAHFDHLDAFVEIMSKTPEALEVKSVYYNLIDKKFFTDNSDDTAFVYDTFIEQVEKHIPEADRHIVQIGDKIPLGEASFEVMYVPENKYVENIINNTSVTYMLTMCGQKVLFLGDSGTESGNSMLNMYKNGELKADFVQMAHHGQAGVRESFYAEVAPKVCLWPTPLWLWENNAGLGYNTHTWETITVKGWMDKLGIKEHYKTYEGTAVITFPYEFKE